MQHWTLKSKISILRETRYTNDHAIISEIDFDQKQKIIQNSFLDYLIFLIYVTYAAYIIWFRVEFVIIES